MKVLTLLSINTRHDVFQGQVPVLVGNIPVIPSEARMDVDLLSDDEEEGDDNEEGHEGT